MVASFAALERQAAALARQVRTLEINAEISRADKRTALELARDLGITLDPWQIEALTTDQHDVLLLVTRQGGKGMVASLLALSKMLNDAGSKTLIVSRADRQARRLLLRIKRLYRQISGAPAAIVDSAYALELMNGSELFALPGSEETVRGLEAIDLLLIDEAALVPDDLAGAVIPMLATTDGRCVAMSTARGKRGWFWREWESSDLEWHRAMVTAPEIPRIKPEWLARTRERIGDFMYRQEFLCEFMETVDQVFSFEMINAALSDAIEPLFAPVEGPWNTRSDSPLF